MSVCRLSIQTDRDGQPVTVDVALPSGTPLGALLPTIVELAGQPSRESAHCWRLDRMSGLPLDESVTLADNGVHDGEVLVLAAFDAPPLGLVRWDPCRTVADAGATAYATPLISEVACAWTAILGSLALCAGVGHPGIRLLVAATGTCTAAALVVIARSTAAGFASVCLAAATGFLAVPSGPAAANVFLAAAAAASMSLLTMRWIDDSSSTLVATASFSALIAVAAITPVVATVPIAPVGAILSVAALGLLAKSGRVSILLSGLAADLPPDDCHTDERAVRGYAALTGLIEGCSGGAALGAVLVAFGCHQHRAPTAAGTCFAAVVAVVLLLRIRTHLDTTCRWALAVGGMISASAAFTTIVVASPDQAGWMNAVIVAIGLALLRPPRLKAGALRALERLEYAALVAVVPLACWVCGVYAMVRGMHLP
ncbi:MAG TPA: type VII secretion integral membrane protein EccD [Mycobacterium sp.]|nr:type VII secretion integral membrane protein EccD [Mycobacterium sp.]